MKRHGTSRIVVVVSVFSMMSEKNATKARKGSTFRSQICVFHVDHLKEIFRVLLILTRVKVGLGRFIQGGQYVALH